MPAIYVQNFKQLVYFGCAEAEKLRKGNDVIFKRMFGISNCRASKIMTADHYKGRYIVVCEMSFLESLHKTGPDRIGFLTRTWPGLGSNAKMSVTFVLVVFYVPNGR